MRFPPFDDEEPTLDYTDNILDVEPLEAVHLELDAEEDDAVYDWFYDHRPLLGTPHVNGPSYRSWRLDVSHHVQSISLGRSLMSDLLDRNYWNALLRRRVSSLPKRWTWPFLYGPSSNLFIVTPWVSMTMIGTNSMIL